MTEKELELLEIAKSAISLNYHINAALTGSLMLSVRKIDKRRESTDIDILVKDINRIKKPDGYWQREIENEEEYEESQYSRFFENKDGIHLEFFEMNVNEQIENINGIPCGSIKEMLDAKFQYWNESGNDKHYEDLKFLNYKFPEKYLEYLTTKYSIFTK